MPFLTLTFPLPGLSRGWLILILYSTGLLATYSCQLPAENNHNLTFSRFHQKTHIQLTSLADTGHILIARTFEQDTLVNTSRWPLPYPVFHLDSGDINRDGTTDLLVGVIKTTRFDPVKRKRLFMFRLVNGYIRPLWLGSRVSQPLEHFRWIQQQQCIRTIEQEPHDLYLVAEYRWRSFGLEFTRYVQRNIGKEDAYRLLEN